MSTPISCLMRKAILRCSATSPAKATNRQRQREEILGASVADFRAFANVLEDLTAEGRVVVLGSQEAIQAVNARRPGFLHVSV